MKVGDRFYNYNKRYIGVVVSARNGVIYVNWIDTVKGGREIHGLGYYASALENTYPLSSLKREDFL